MKGAALCGFLFVLVLANVIQAQTLSFFGKNTQSNFDSAYNFLARNTYGSQDYATLFNVADMTGAAASLFGNFDGPIRETGSGFIINNIVTPAGNIFDYQITVSQEIPAISFVLTLTNITNSTYSQANVFVDFLYSDGYILTSDFGSTTITTVDGPDMYISANDFPTELSDETYFTYTLYPGTSIMMVVYLDVPGAALTWNPPTYLNDQTFLVRADLLPGLSLAKLQGILNWNFQGFNVASYTQICQFPNEIKNRNGINNRRQQRHPFTEAWAC